MIIILNFITQLINSRLIVLYILGAAGAKFLCIDQSDTSLSREETNKISIFIRVSKIAKNDS